VDPPGISGYPGATLLQMTGNTAQVTMRVQGLTGDPTKEALGLMRCAGVAGFGFLGETANYSYGSGTALWTWIFTNIPINGQSYALSFQQKQASGASLDAMEMNVKYLEIDDGDGGAQYLGNGFSLEAANFSGNLPLYPTNPRGPNLTGRLYSLYTNGSTLFLRYDGVTGTVTKTGAFGALEIPGFGTFTSASAATFQYTGGSAYWVWNTTAQLTLNATYFPTFTAP
jgi:hypothetical protein